MFAWAFRRAYQPVPHWSQQPRSVDRWMEGPSPRVLFGGFGVWFRVHFEFDGGRRRCCGGLIIQGSKRGRAPNRIWPITWKMSNQKIRFFFFLSFPSPAIVVGRTGVFPKILQHERFKCEPLPVKGHYFCSFCGCWGQNGGKTVAKNCVHQRANQKFIFGLSYDLFAGNYQAKKKEATKIAPCKQFFFYF